MPCNIHMSISSWIYCNRNIYETQEGAQVLTKVSQFDWKNTSASAVTVCISCDHNMTHIDTCNRSAIIFLQASSLKQAECFINRSRRTNNDVRGRWRWVSCGICIEYPVSVIYRLNSMGALHVIPTKLKYHGTRWDNEKLSTIPIFCDIISRY